MSRNYQVMVRFSDQEYKQFLKICVEKNISRGLLCRISILDNLKIQSFDSHSNRVKTLEQQLKELEKEDV